MAHSKCLTVRHNIIYFESTVFNFGLLKIVLLHIRLQLRLLFYFSLQNTKFADIRVINSVFFSFHNGNTVEV